MKILPALPLGSLLVATLTACAGTKSNVPLEAPELMFKKAVVVAATAPDARKDVEEFVTAEIQARRPNVQVTPTYKLYPSLDGLTEQQFQAYLDTHGVDIVVTIVPFAEVAMAQYDEWADVADEDFHEYIGHVQATALMGNIGVQVAAWDAKTWEPKYAKTSQIIVGQVAGPRGVADFAAGVVTRDL